MCSWPELWLRWVQYGVFSPVFRTHCEAECSCQPWDYMVDNIYEDAITAAFQRREMLMPYIYTAAHSAYRTGVAINHPVYYVASEHDEAYALENRQSYFFGGDILVGAIAHAGVGASSAELRTARNIWLPTGRWCTWFQHRASCIDGPTVINGSFALAETPVYVRAGAIIPTQQPGDGARTGSVAVWKLFPPAESGGGEGWLYGDDGTGLGYQRGSFSLQHAQQNWTTDTTKQRTLRASVTPTAAGDAPPASVHHQFQVLRQDADSAAPVKVECNGDTAHEGTKGCTECWWIGREGPWTAVTIACSSPSLLQHMVSVTAVWEGHGQGKDSLLKTDDLSDATCQDDLGCSLNGHCDPGSGCECDDGWVGTHCERLDMLPTTAASAFDVAGSTSSFGGSAAWDPITRLFHGYFAEIYDGCGIKSWHNGQIVHGTSPTLDGVFTRQDVAVGAQVGLSTLNPDVQRCPVTGEWLLLHIGDGSTAGQAAPHDVCSGWDPASVPPHGATAAGQDPQAPAVHRPTRVTKNTTFPTARTTAPGNFFHHSRSPDGPWQPLMPQQAHDS